MPHPIEPGQVTASNTAEYAKSLIKMQARIRRDSVLGSAVYEGLLELRDRILILESNEIPESTASE